MPLQVALLFFCNTVYQKIILKILGMITSSNIWKFSCFLSVLHYFEALHYKTLRNIK